MDATLSNGIKTSLLNFVGSAANQGVGLESVGEGGAAPSIDEECGVCKPGLRGEGMVVESACEEKANSFYRLSSLPSCVKVRCVLWSQFGKKTKE